MQHIGDARADIADAASDLSRERAAEPPRQRSALGLVRGLRARHLVALAAVVFVIAASVWAARFFTTSTLSLAEAGIVPLTTSGNATLGVIAPDGDSVVYVQTDGTKGDSLRLIQIDSGANEDLVAPQPGRITAVTVSPDGVYADFVRAQTLWRVPTVGPPPSSERIWNLSGVSGPLVSCSNAVSVESSKGLPLLKCARRA